jgi:GDP-4-dehydro-6-deoxy-D-mannose reductase
MRTLVTGAGGFVGGHLIRNLSAAGHDVVAASHRPFQTESGVQAEVFDILDDAAVKKIAEEHEPEGVVHLAAQASVPRSWENPEETYRTNIIGASNLLDSLKERPQTRVLLVGSAQEYGSVNLGRPLLETDPPRPESPYAISKVAQELIGLLFRRSFGLAVILARPFNHTGPGQSREYAVGAFCSQIVELETKKRDRIEVGNLGSRRDFLDVRDVADAYRMLLEAGAPGEAYNVASGEGIRVGDLLKILLNAAGLSSSIVVEDPTRRPGDPGSLVGDVAKLRSAVGWQPKVSLEKSLVDTLNWYRSDWEAA